MRNPLLSSGASRRTEFAQRLRPGRIHRRRRNRAIPAFARWPRGMPSPTSYKTPSVVRAPCLPHRGGKMHECGNRDDSGLRDLPAIVVDRDAHVIAWLCRKRNTAGRPSICPATLGNVNCLDRLSQPGGAVIHHPLYRLRNSNEPIRWALMRASASSSGRPELPDDGASDHSALRRHLQSGWWRHLGVILCGGEPVGSPTRLAVARLDPGLRCIPSHLSSSLSGFFCADCEQPLR